MVLANVPSAGSGKGLEMKLGREKVQRIEGSADSRDKPHVHLKQWK
jgi:hypothetical protein